MKKSRLRLVTYNIHKGFSLGNRDFVLEKIRRGIRHLKADIVCLQEVSGENHEHRKKIHNYPLTSQFEYLADEMWPHFAYGKNAVYQRGHHGNAILSRFPMAHTNTIDLSTNRMERRGLLHARVPHPELGTIHVLTVHLNLLESSRRKQAQVILNYMEGHVPRHETAVLAGDFNDWRQTLGPLFFEWMGLRDAHLEHHGFMAQTYPSIAPVLALDRIYVRGLRVDKCHRVEGEDWSQLSDHLALMAELG